MVTVLEFYSRLPLRVLSSMLFEQVPFVQFHYRFIFSRAPDALFTAGVHHRMHWRLGAGSEAAACAAAHDPAGAGAAGVAAASTANAIAAGL
jgi:hypothetical protein